jgi:hypothetical protein
MKKKETRMPMRHYGSGEVTDVSQGEQQRLFDQEEDQQFPEENGDLSEENAPR